ncbi:MAG: hypothetical protein IPQ16_14935 [Geobacteraceae bacterium]|nr:hypothetical protein [Geobacteraceae bacterium]
MARLKHRRQWRQRNGHLPGTGLYKQGVFPNTTASDTPPTITFSLSNANSIILTNAAFTDSLTGMAINSNQSAGGTCGGVAGNSFALGQTGLLTFSGLSIPPGGCTVTIVVTSDVPGNYNITTSGVTTTQTTIGAISNMAHLRPSRQPPPPLPRPLPRPRSTRVGDNDHLYPC